MGTSQEFCSMTAFVCANCAGAGSAPSTASRVRPEVPDFGWPGSVRQVLVPCTGRLQPEHILRAFESGSSIVSVVACRDDKCQYIEGSRRCARRLDYIRSILKEIGLGEERLLSFHLSGSASGDPDPAAGKPADSCSPDLPARLAEIKDQAMQALKVQPLSPLARLPAESDVSGHSGRGSSE